MAADGNAHLDVDADLRRARLPPAAFYTDPRAFDAVRERVFARSWHLVAHESELAAPGARRPLTLLPGLLDEPVLLTRAGDGVVRALSNVCTHRGAIVCPEAVGGDAGVDSHAGSVAGPAPRSAPRSAPGAGAADAPLRCPYHGRRYALDGRFLSMPGLPDAARAALEAFGAGEADLPAAPLARWRGFLFAGVAPDHACAELTDALDARTAHLPVERAVPLPGSARDYDVPAHWALYLENYLEGIHVPYVHPALASSFDLVEYRCVTARRSSVQVGVAPAEADDRDVLMPPPGAPEHGMRVSGYFVFLWPATLVNVYPWGLSLNLVQPVSPTRTRVAFRSWAWDAARLGRGAAADLHRVELEDEAIVASCQRGAASRLRRRGHYLPGAEDCVHHFHRLLAAALAGSGAGYGAGDGPRDGAGRTPGEGHAPPEAGR
jgi:choline monooxygenase